ncbi:Gfo/Idh/MocA family oxidoreductase [Microbacterium sp. 10M-3C3]|jgi:predicted dehydrogenase|uniref:Gfo/Idh/MocA family protein n=1 Tax=Microbacterium sp. 10M-3C3 TaxID=2483401 RepID=UPI000F6402FB|nr:Gfo/Idh/MocA family oxidoreductase [Microbacterium sp. 10M-3C3]
MAWGVGLIGAGPGVAALHAPTLARVADDFRLVHVADSGSGRAAAIAAAHGARASSDVQTLLDDEDVDVVGICSPPELHAAHIRAALRAGRRIILCEKPIATTADEAWDVLRECADAGALVVVGTNHLFDPLWARVKRHIDAAEERVRTVSVTMALAPNARYHALVTGEESTPTTAARPPLDFSDPQLCARVVRQLVVGLAVHDLPLVRDLLPGFEEIVHARAIPPIGLDIGLRTGGGLVRLSAVMLPDGADTLWRVSVGMGRDRVDLDFPPPFVHAGSARATVRDGSGRITTFPVEDIDGYEAEWRALAALARGDTTMEYAELLADAEEAIAIADAAAEAVRAGMTS